MRWNTSFIVVLLYVLVLSCVTHASDYKCVLDTQCDKSLTQVKEDKSAMNNAIKIYLDKNPPKLITEFMYSAIEKARTVSVSDAGRDKVINHIKENVTPEIISKMISAGLKRNFTAPEIIELAKNDDSELSKNLKQKIDIFRYEVSSEIKLLIAALNG